ncbi:MAG: hypothetical protein M3405_08245 [Acidobacteriota bacterium]|nr:hypothetical protein [Acidobacteriota bacterium]
MVDFLQENREKKGINKGLIIGGIIGIIIIAGIIGLIAMLPSTEEIKQEELKGAYLEGTPEFEKYTNEIIITTNMDRTTQARTGLGSILMNIAGKIRNKGDKTLDGLEVNVRVVDICDKTIKEKNVLIIPKRQETLSPNETIDVVVNISGFDPESDRANVRWKVSAIRFAK